MAQKCQQSPLAPLTGALHGGGPALSMRPVGRSGARARDALRERGSQHCLVDINPTLYPVASHQPSPGFDSRGVPSPQGTPMESPTDRLLEGHLTRPSAFVVQAPVDVLRSPAHRAPPWRAPLTDSSRGN